MPLPPLAPRLAPLIGPLSAPAPTHAAPAPRASAWFNEALVDSARVLRAPMTVASGASAQALADRFLACLCE